MDQQTLAMYLYMCSTEPIIKWLEKEGVKTKEQALDKLRCAAQSNVYSWASHVGAGHGGSVSLAGTANGVKKIVEHFENKEKSKKDKKKNKKKNGKG